MKHISLFTCALLLATACSQPQKEHVAPQEATVIHVESDWEMKPGMKISEFVKDIEFVLLELTDDCPLNNILSQVEIMDEYIYVIEYPVFRSQCVYQFDRKGKFVRRIGSKGEGPEEFTRMGGFALNRETKSLYVFDDTRKKLLTYRPDGSFAGSIDAHNNCDAFLYNPPFFYVYNTYKYSPKDTISKPVRVLDLQGNEKARYLADYLQTAMTVDGQFTRNTEGQTLFCQELNDTVYVCDEQGAHVRYIFDFGDNTMTPEKKLEYMEALYPQNLKKQLQLQRDYFMKASNVWETDRWLFFNALKGLVNFYGVYDKEEKQAYVQTGFEDDLYHIGVPLGSNVGMTPDGKAIAYANANYIRDMVRKQLPNNPSLEPLNALFEQVTGNEDEELNPMLLIVTFKE